MFKQRVSFIINKNTLKVNNSIEFTHDYKDSFDKIGSDGIKPPMGFSGNGFSRHCIERDSERR